MTNVHLKGKRVHLITQDPIVAQLIRDILAPHKVMIFHADTPKKAVVHAISKPADLLIYDEKMPALDGKDLLHAIRMKLPKTPLAFVSEHGGDSCTIDYSARGADAIIGRNADNHQVYNAICHAMGVPFEREPGVRGFHGVLNSEAPA